MTARWRVVRQSSGGTGTDVCRHRFERIAYWCKRRNERREPLGVWFDVRPVAPAIRHRMASTHVPTAAEREYALAVINLAVADFAKGMQNADDETLRHEAERLEAEPNSPVVKSMRAIVDEVRTARAEAVSS